MLFQFGGSIGNTFFRSLERWGFIDSLFPFALVFVIIYGILRKIRIFGQDASNRFDVIIALVSATAFVYPHFSGAYRSYGVVDPVVLINTAIPQIGIILVAVVLFLVLIGTLGFKEFKGPLQQMAVLASIFIVGYIFMNSAGYFQSPWLSFLSDPDIQAFIVVVLVLGGLLFFLGDEGESKEAGKGLKEFLQNIVGSGGK